MIRIVIKQFFNFIILVVAVVGITFGISLLNNTYPPEVQAAEPEERVGQIHLQQEAVTQFYEEIFTDKPSAIILSASGVVKVSVTVLDNLSLSVVDGQPKYATNWKFGATVHKERVSPTQIAYTVAADY